MLQFGGVRNKPNLKIESSWGCFCESNQPRRPTNLLDSLPDSDQEETQRVLEMSKREAERVQQEQEKRQKQEEEELNKVHSHLTLRKPTSGLKK